MIEHFPVWAVEFWFPRILWCLCYSVPFQLTKMSTLEDNCLGTSDSCFGDMWIIIWKRSIIVIMILSANIQCLFCNLYSLVNVSNMMNGFPIWFFFVIQRFRSGRPVRHTGQIWLTKLTGKITKISHKYGQKLFDSGPYKIFFNENNNKIISKIIWQ